MFSSAQEIHAAGPGLFGESVSIDSCGAPAAGGSCSGGDDATDMNRSAYCEHAGTSVMLLTDRLGYASVGTISQGAIENPDSLEFRSSADGSGLG
ncbi:MAG TPA: hypothetical protein VMS89_06190, partial [Methanoregulaceae archaeon]|nr:hypothetical protein [Methanoregulaceae archaeon]